MRGDVATDIDLYPRLLTTTGLVYAIVHHLGLLPDGLGAGPDGTRWADWLDLAVPWLVLVPAALTLWAAQAVPRAWAVFGAGAVAYASGHGLHLAANSVGNVDPGVTAHLWDEVVGHYVWFAGVALVLAALWLTMLDRPRPRLVGHAVSWGVGLTWASNAVGGGTVAFSAVVAVVAAYVGWRDRRGLGVVLLSGFTPAALWLAGVLIVG
jgi:hypothetical protein